MPATPPSRSIFLLAAIAALGSLGTQLLVPVLPILAHDLAIEPGDAQLFIAIYLIGLAIGQLVAGPLVDRRNRATMLQAGLALYCMASLGAALAVSYEFLLAARFVQALGAAVGLVTSRVLVSDLYPPDEAVRRQSTLMAVVLISPAIAPVIGGVMGEFAGWRSIMLVLFAAGIGGMVWTGMSLPNLLPSRTTKQRQFGGDLVKLARNRRFLTTTLTIAGGSSALYMFLSAAPFLLAHDHGLRPRAVGFALMLIALSSIAGTFAAARIDRRGRALLAGSGLLLLAPLILLMVQIAGWSSLVAFQLPMCLLGLGAGICAPAGIARVLRSEPGLEGTSTALCGALQMAASAVSAAVLSRLSHPDTTVLATGLIVPSGMAFATAVMEKRL